MHELIQTDQCTYTTLTCMHTHQLTKIYAVNNYVSFVTLGR